MAKKWKIALFVFLIAIGCKKAFIPKEINSTNNRYLVIEGVVSSGNDSTFIRISRTQRIDTIHTVNPERNALVTVESDENSTYALTEKNAGIYTTAALNLDPAHKYRLRIKTSDHKEYLSDFVAVKNSPPIDSVGFVAQGEGLQIYVNSHDATNSTHYYRWEYNETWQFRTKYVSAYTSNYIDSIRGRHANEKVDVCFQSDTSTNIVIASSIKLANDVIFQAPLTKVLASSEKIETKYSIFVKQYALTSDAYTFWEDLQKNTEKVGSIFDVLPSENESNFHCITNPDELVVGYLSIGVPASKRIFISVDQLPASYSTTYPFECEIDTSFFDPTGHPGNLPVNAFLPADSPYVPIIALYPIPDPFGMPYAYTYSSKLCADCTIRGTTKRPAFWK